MEHTETESQVKNGQKNKSKQTCNLTHFIHVSQDGSAKENHGVRSVPIS